MRGDELRAALLGVVARAAELDDTFGQEVRERRAAAAGESLVSFVIPAVALARGDSGAVRAEPSSA